jgi:hypothetical protein
MMEYGNSCLAERQINSLWTYQDVITCEFTARFNVLVIVTPLPGHGSPANVCCTLSAGKQTDSAAHGWLSGGIGGPRDAHRCTVIVGLRQMCTGSVVVVFVAEGACIGLPRCGVATHTAFVISFIDASNVFLRSAGIRPRHHSTKT